MSQAKTIGENDMEVHNMFATPKSMKDLMDYIGSLNEPTHYIVAMMMWNLIASGNHESELNHFKKGKDNAA